MRTNIFVSTTPSTWPSRVLVVGDVMLDPYTWGEADRVSPEAPVLVLKAQREEARLGGAVPFRNGRKTNFRVRRSVLL
ncbi:MAG TPA: hypothetical protein VG125_18945 [Pirellulales bacterium]|nr:hypothetical protein [Pirellulales bacterium]